MFPEKDELLPEVDRLFRAISETCPAGGVPAGQMLAIFCRPWLEQIRSGAPLCTSLLTPGGYPLEFAFGTDSRNISYTVEPGPPQSSVEEKWRFVRRIVSDLDPRFHPLLRRLLEQPAQRFGCWLGIRHRGPSVGLKVYQEITPEGRELVLSYLRHDVPELTEMTGLKPTLLGLTSGTGGPVEYYCRIDDSNLGVLHKFFGAAGVPRHLPCVIDHLAYLAAAQRSKLWDRLHIGISYSVSAGASPALTLFADASQLFPTNVWGRIRLLGLARQLGRQIPVYERITSSFEREEPPRMVHGLVGIKVSHSGHIDCAVGLQPF